MWQRGVCWVNAVPSESHKTGSANSSLALTLWSVLSTLWGGWPWPMRPVGRRGGQREDGVWVGHRTVSCIRARVAEWQTRRSQKPVGFYVHVGSNPTSGTIFYALRASGAPRFVVSFVPNSVDFAPPPFSSLPPTLGLLWPARLLFIRFLGSRGRLVRIVNGG